MEIRIVVILCWSCRLLLRVVLPIFLVAIIISPAHAGTRDFVKSLEFTTQKEQAVAASAAQRKLHGRPVDRILRSRTIALDPTQIFAEDVVDRITEITTDLITQLPVLLDSEGEPIEPVAVERITLSPFLEITFVIENTNLYVLPWGFVWKGKIVEGGSGDITIYDIAPYDVCRIIINSNLGQFNVLYTDTPPYHVVTEINTTIPLIYK